MRREFTKRTKALAFQRANMRCEECHYRLSLGKYHYDHDIPDGLTGDNSLANCRVLCVLCHNHKTGKDIGRIAKAKRVYAKHIGAVKSRNPLPGGKLSAWKRKITGEVVKRCPKD